MQIIKVAVLVITQLICLLKASPTNRNTVAQMPPNCTNLNYCIEKGDYYPVDLIKNVLWDFPLNITTVKETEHRDNEQDYDDICYKTEINRAIHYIRDQNDNVRYVINQENRFEQVFPIVTCSETGPLHIFDACTICQYKVKCSNELVPVKFLVLSLDKTKAEMVDIKDGLPMACSCKYSYDKLADTECFAVCNNPPVYPDDDDDDDESIEI